jgi:hypothetical protein
LGFFLRGTQVSDKSSEKSAQTSDFSVKTSTEKVCLSRGLPHWIGRMKHPEPKKKLIKKLRILFTLEFTKRFHQGEHQEFETIYQRFRHPLKNWVSLESRSPTGSQPP